MLAIFVYRNYVIQLMAIDNHVFSVIGPYSTLIYGLAQANQGRMFEFWSNFSIDTRSKVNWK